MRTPGPLLCLALLAPLPGTAAPPTVPAPAADGVAKAPAPSPAVVRRVSRLIETIRNPASPDERERAVDGILAVGPRALPLVVAELEHRSRMTWPVMIYLLGALGDPRAIPILEKELTHQSGVPRQEILYALALAGKGEEALVAAMRGGDALVKFDGQMTAVDYIAGLMGREAIPILEREIPRRAKKSRLAGFSALGTVCDTEAVPFLLAWSRQPLPSDRRGALQALARIGDPRARGPLVQALGDRDPTVRETAAEAVGYMRIRRAVPSLVRILRSSRPSPVKTRATWALALIGDEEATTALVEALGRANDRERPLLLQAIGRSRHPAAIPPLLEEALKEKTGLGYLAVDGLRHVHTPRANDALLMICGGAPDHDIGLQAALELLRRRDPRAVPCTLQRLRDELDTRRGIGPFSEEILRILPLAAPAGAADSLERMAREVSAPALRHRIRACAHGIRLVAEYGTDPDPWIRLLEEGTPEEVDLAVERLGDLRDPRAVEPLRRLFGRLEPEQAWRIPRALGEIGSDRATPFLVSLLTDDLYRAPGLLRAREEAARALARYSRSPHAADAILAFYRERHGRSLVPLLAYAHMRGADAIPVLVEEKRLLLRHRGAIQARRHERVNWTLVMLRGGRELPWEEVRDVDE